MATDARALAIEANRRAYDFMYAMITDRNCAARRQFVAGIETYLRERFRDELANPVWPLFRDTFNEFFRLAARDDAVGNVLQMYCVHMNIFLDAKIVANLCPPPPDPDTDDADLSRVDRVAFAMYQLKGLRPMMHDLIDGTSLTVPTFTRELNALYTSLLPADPVLEHAATQGRRNRRRITFAQSPINNNATDDQ